jgi:hypothetical protein
VIISLPLDSLNICIIANRIYQQMCPFTDFATLQQAIQILNTLLATNMSILHTKMFTLTSTSECTSHITRNRATLYSLLIILKMAFYYEFFINVYCVGLMVAMLKQQQTVQTLSINTLITCYCYTTCEEPSSLQL